MRISLLIVPALAAVSIAALAQSPANPAHSELHLKSSNAYIILPAWCPVNLQAKQSGMTDMVKVKDGEPAPPPSPGPRQRIHLVIGKGGVGRVASATVTARGLSARSRMNQTLRDGNATSDIRRTVDVKFTPGEDGTMHADLVLPGFTAVNSIKLESITYADGTTGDVSNKTACAVRPDPVMPVADR